MTITSIYRKQPHLTYSQEVQAVLDACLLTDFARSGNSDSQTFTFTLHHNGKNHTLSHIFEYHGAGVSHSFRWNKGKVFQQKPFSLSKEVLIELSDALMDVVNAFHRK